MLEGSTIAGGYIVADGGIFCCSEVPMLLGDPLLMGQGLLMPTAGGSIIACRGLLLLGQIYYCRECILFLGGRVCCCLAGSIVAGRIYCCKRIYCCWWVGLFLLWGSYVVVGDPLLRGVDRGWRQGAVLRGRSGQREYLHLFWASLSMSNGDFPMKNQK